MMGIAEKQKNIFHTVQIEDLVPQEHPLRKIRPLVNTERIRELCKDFYCADNGRPSIPPEQLFLAMLGGYLLGVRSDRKLILELSCNRHPAKSLKHSVSKVDIESIFSQDAIVFAGRIIEPAHPEWRGLILGVSRNGRNLSLIFTRRGDRLRPISCRSMRKQEVNIYHEKTKH